MKSLLSLVLVLGAICLVAGALLAFVNQVTERPIAEAMRREKLAAIEQVLPAHDNQPDTDLVTLEDGGKTWTFFVGRKGGRYVGAAFEVTSSKGYGGTIRLMVGVNADGTMEGLAVLEQKETPGLGAKIQDPGFRDGFRGRSLTNTNWKVRKDGGDIDAITAATISSRAVTDAVAEGIEVYLRHETAIRTGPHPVSHISHPTSRIPHPAPEVT